jgi:CHAD domain-containing protein
LTAVAFSADGLGDAALHRARVDCKRLRYLVEFFADPLGEAASEAIAAIERLQDALGAFNDLGVQLRALERALREVPRDSADAVERASALGALIELLESRRAKARRRSLRRVAELAEKKSARVFERLLDAA